MTLRITRMGDYPYRKSDPKPDPLPARVWYSRASELSIPAGGIVAILLMIGLMVTSVSYVLRGGISGGVVRFFRVEWLMVVGWCLAFLRYGRNPPSGAYVFATGEKVP